MYKFKSYLMALLAAGSVAFLSSCGDDTDDPAKPKPTLDFVAVDNTFTTGDKTVTGGDSIRIRANMNSATSGNNLKTFTLSVSYDGAVATTLAENTSVGGESYNYVFRGRTRTTAGTERYDFKIVDNDGQSTTKSITITTTDPNSGANVNTYTAQMMGAQANASVGSFFNTADGTVLLVNQAKAQSSTVDFVYFYGATNGATVAAPNDADALTISALQLGNFSTKNATKFKSTSMTASDFSSATSSSALETAFTGATGEDSKANNLSVGDIVAFKTAAGKYGIFKVTALNANTSGSITIDVKVQK